MAAAPGMAEAAAPEPLDQALSAAVCAHTIAAVDLVRRFSLSAHRARLTRALAQGDGVKFASVATSAIHGLADLLAAYITEVGSAARAQGELSGRSESHLLDVMMALRAEGLPFAELLQHMRAPPPGRIPANLLPGGPLSCPATRSD